MTRDGEEMLERREEFYFFNVIGFDDWNSEIQSPFLIFASRVDH